EGILASKLSKKKFTVDSAGTGSWHIGHKPDERSIATAKRNGIDISNQKGRQFSTTDFDTFDYIYVMDKSNYEDVIHLAKTLEQEKKVQMILNELFPNENVDVPDPYYGSLEGFDPVYKMLDEACEIIAKKLIEKHR
ncbi:low molecular weight protein-tyrosine-phosphatase, partial [Flavobacterium sp.]|uniref:low molecular weight protein-tyrosine-phosphatase n=1 Tax=Flavobacterium sp. TaxID=239 RepID=UPI003795A389